MLSCGEASGDLYAAALARELRAQHPGVTTFGFGGPRLAAAGANLVGDYKDFAVTGLSEALSVVPQSFRMLRKLGDLAAERRPHVFVAIDFPDFNFRLLPVMAKLGVPVVYYVSPQLWAWRPGRIKQIQKFVSKMLVIFPFEVDVYERAKVPVEFVGHPLVELVDPSASNDSWVRTLGLDPDRPILALLPGSRPNEIERHAPVMAAALPLIAQSVPGVQFLIARAPSLPDRVFDVFSRGAWPVRVVEGAADAVLSAADAVVTASGTATVQTALHGKPMVIIYRLSGLTYAMGRAFVKVPHYGMVNLIAGRRIATELIQDECTADAIHAETVPLLTDVQRIAQFASDLAEVRERLGGAGATARAARAVLAAVTPS
jgi:lipid-A-disaccharide synthase